MKTINYKNMEWIILEQNKDCTKLLLKDVLSAEIIKDICEDESYYENGMAHRNNLKYPYDWKISNIRMVLNTRFLDNYLDKNDLEKMGDDYVRLLTKDEVEDLDDEIKECDDWYWTMSRYDSSNVWYVSSSGSLSNGNVYDFDYGVRPVITILTSKISSDTTGDMTSKTTGGEEFNEESNKIEQIDMKYYQDEPANICDLAHKIFEIIDEVNKLKEKNEGE